MNAYKKYLMTMGMVWAGSLFVFIIIHIFLISPQLKIKADLNRQLTDAKRLFDSAVAAANDDNKKKLTSEVESLKVRLSGYAADTAESANLTFDIGRLAGDKQLSSFTVKTPDMAWGSEQIDSKNLQENRVDVSFNSDYKRFASFLNALERHRPVIFINRFKLTRGDQGLSSGKADMDLSFYVKKKTEG
jgi:Tfp pilus assembly protein PilO